MPTLDAVAIVEAFWADGSRVASRFLIRGRNNSFPGTTPDQRPFASRVAR